MKIDVRAGMRAAGFELRKFHQRNALEDHAVQDAKAASATAQPIATTSSAANANRQDRRQRALTGAFAASLLVAGVIAADEICLQALSPKIDSSSRTARATRPKPLPSPKS